MFLWETGDRNRSGGRSLVPTEETKMWKRRRSGLAEIWNRETGQLMPRAFCHRFWASKDVVLRFGIHKKLEKHRGCVNTVSFNADGNIVISGSDDRMIIMWDWDIGTAKLSFHSGHRNNIFDAKFVPYTDDRRIVTCAADGEVRYVKILEGGQVDTKKLVKHKGSAHKLAFDPGTPHTFYSCGEDGLVYHIDLRTESSTPFFTCKSIQNNSTFSQINPLNAIAMHPRNLNLIAVAGTDEYARLFDIRTHKFDGSTDHSNPCDCYCPPHLIGSGQIGITGLAFSEQCELLASYCDELIYLFSLDQGLGPDPTPASPVSATHPDNGKTSPASASPSSVQPDHKQELPSYGGHRNCDTMKGVSFFGPNSEYVVSGSDCGRIFIWRKRDGELLRVMEADTHIVNCIQSHPHGPVLASSGIENNVKIWIPNAAEPAAPINIDEVLMRDRISFFDDYDYFPYESDIDLVTDDDDDDDDNDDVNDCYDDDDNDMYVDDDDNIDDYDDTISS